MVKRNGSPALGSPVGWRRRVLAALCAGVISSPAVGVSAPWPPEDQAVPLSVRTPQDLTFKSEVERLYLAFKLMAAGKVAYDAGDFATAVRRWDELLKLPDLDPDHERLVRPLLAEARRQTDAGNSRPSGAAAPISAPDVAATSPAATPSSSAPSRVAVTGSVTGGGPIGPGGTVLWLKRADGPTPQARPLRRVVNQKNKAFVPRVVAVPVGSKVDFRNDDPYYHNVFSLSKAQRFDTGLYAAGKSYIQTFDRPGPVELLCNIHAAMIGYVYVVDSPWYAQPRTGGSFAIRNVPPGKYDLHAWHESSLQVVKQPLTVGADGVQGIIIRIPSDKPPMVVVPDKYGKPRQPQLGY